MVNASHRIFLNEHNPSLTESSRSTLARDPRKSP